MENYCTNILPKKVTLVALKQFLLLLGYQREQGKPLSFYFFKRDDYKYYSGVEAEIERAIDHLEIKTWIDPNANSFDLDYQVFTIQQLKAHFGGSFETDAGTNKIEWVDLPSRIGAESGCYLAFSRFQTNVGRIKVFLSTRGISNFPPPEIDRRSRNRHPAILSNNLIVPFLVATMEDFFRSSFVALLQYSEAKGKLLSKARLTSEDLVDISSQNTTVESAFARHLSFQNIDRICGHFKDLNGGLDLNHALGKKIKKSNLSMLVALRELLDRRNKLIHQTRLDPDYLDKRVKRDLQCVEQAVSAVYAMFIKFFDWQLLDV